MKNDIVSILVSAEVETKDTVANIITSEEAIKQTESITTPDIKPDTSQSIIPVEEKNEEEVKQEETKPEVAIVTPENKPKIEESVIHTEEKKEEVRREETKPEVAVATPDIKPDTSQAVIPVEEKKEDTKVQEQTKPEVAVATPENKPKVEESVLPVEDKKEEDKKVQEQTTEVSVSTPTNTVDQSATPVQVNVNVEAPKPEEKKELTEEEKKQQTDDLRKSLWELLDKLVKDTTKEAKDIDKNFEAFKMLKSDKDDEYIKGLQMIQAFSKENLTQDQHSKFMQSIKENQEKTMTIAGREMPATITTDGSIVPKTQDGKDLLKSEEEKDEAVKKTPVILETIEGYVKTLIGEKKPKEEKKKKSLWENLKDLLKLLGAFLIGGGLAALLSGLAGNIGDLVGKAFKSIFEGGEKRLISALDAISRPVQGIYESITEHFRFVKGLMGFEDKGASLAAKAAGQAAKEAGIKGAAEAGAKAAGEASEKAMAEATAKSAEEIAEAKKAIIESAKKGNITQEEFVSQMKKVAPNTTSEELEKLVTDTYKSTLRPDIKALISDTSTAIRTNINTSGIINPELERETARIFANGSNPLITSMEEMSAGMRQAGLTASKFAVTVGGAAAEVGKFGLDIGKAITKKTTDIAVSAAEGVKNRVNNAVTTITEPIKNAYQGIKTSISERMPILVGPPPTTAAGLTEEMMYNNYGAELARREGMEAAAQAGAESAQKGIIERMAGIGLEGAMKGAAMAGTVGSGIWKLGTGIGSIASDAGTAVDNALLERYGWKYRIGSFAPKMLLGMPGFAVDSMETAASMGKSIAKLDASGVTNFMNAAKAVEAREVMAPGEGSWAKRTGIKIMHGVDKVSTPVMNMVSKIVNTVFGTISKLLSVIPGFDGGKLQKFSADIAKAFSDKLAGKAATVALGGILSRCFMVYFAAELTKAFYDGMTNPGEIFQVQDNNKCGPGMRALAGIANVFSHVLLQLIEPKTIASIILKVGSTIFDLDEEVQELQTQQANSEAMFEEWKAADESRKNATFKDYMVDTGSYNNKSVLSNIADAVTYGVKEFIGDLPKFILEKVGNLGKGLFNIGAYISDLGQYWNKVSDVSSQMFRANLAPEEIKQMADSLAVADDDPLKGIKETIRDFASNHWFLMGTVGWLVGKFTDTVGGLISGIGNTVVKAKDTAVGMIQGAMEGDPLKVLQYAYEDQAAVGDNGNGMLSAVISKAVVIPLAIPTLTIATAIGAFNKISDFVGSISDSLAMVPEGSKLIENLLPLAMDGNVQAVWEADNPFVGSDVHVSGIGGVIGGTIYTIGRAFLMPIAGFNWLMNGLRHGTEKLVSWATGSDFSLDWYVNFEGNPISDEYMNHSEYNFDPAHPITAIPSVIETIYKYLHLPIKAVSYYLGKFLEGPGIFDSIGEKVGWIKEKFDWITNLMDEGDKNAGELAKHTADQRRRQDTGETSVVNVGNGQTAIVVNTNSDRQSTKDFMDAFNKSFKNKDTLDLSGISAEEAKAALDEISRVASNDDMKNEEKQKLLTIFRSRLKQLLASSVGVDPELTEKVNLAKKQLKKGNPNITDDRVLDYIVEASVQTRMSGKTINKIEGHPADSVADHKRLDTNTVPTPTTPVNVPDRPQNTVQDPSIATYATGREIDTVPTPTAPVNIPTTPQNIIQDPSIATYATGREVNIIEAKTKEELDIVRQELYSKIENVAEVPLNTVKDVLEKSKNTLSGMTNAMIEGDPARVLSTLYEDQAGIDGQAQGGITGAVSKILLLPLNSLLAPMLGISTGIKIFKTTSSIITENVESFKAVPESAKSVVSLVPLALSGKVQDVWDSKAPYAKKTIKDGPGYPLGNTMYSITKAIMMPVASMNWLGNTIKDGIEKFISWASGTKFSLDWYDKFKDNPLDGDYLKHSEYKFDPKHPISAIPSVVETIYKWINFPLKTISFYLGKFLSAGSIFDTIKQKVMSIKDKVSGILNIFGNDNKTTTTPTTTITAKVTTPTVPTTNPLSTAVTNTSKEIKELLTIYNSEFKNKQTLDLEGPSGQQISEAIKNIKIINSDNTLTLNQKSEKIKEYRNTIKKILMSSKETDSKLQEKIVKAKERLKTINNKITDEKLIEYLVEASYNTAIGKKPEEMTKGKGTGVSKHSMSLGIPNQFQQNRPGYDKIAYNIKGDTQRETIASRGCGPEAFRAATKAVTGKTLDEFSELDNAKRDIKPNDGTDFTYFRRRSKDLGMGLQETTNKAAIRKAAADPTKSVITMTQEKGQSPHYKTKEGLLRGRSGKYYYKETNPEAATKVASDASHEDSITKKAFIFSRGKGTIPDDTKNYLKDLEKADERKSVARQSKSRDANVFGRGQYLDTGDADLKARTDFAWAWLTSEGGLTKEGAAAAIGNMVGESGNLHPGMVEAGVPDPETGKTWNYGDYAKEVTETNMNIEPGQPGFGIFQFTSPVLKKELLEYAQSKGLSTGTLTAQLGAFKYSNTEGCASFRKPYWEEMGTNKPVPELTEVWCAKLEVPGDIEGTLPTRIEAAQEAYNLYKDQNLQNIQDPTGGGAASSGTTPTTPGSASIPSGQQQSSTTEAGGILKKVYDIFFGGTSVSSGNVTSPTANTPTGTTPSSGTTVSGPGKGLADAQGEARHGTYGPNTLGTVDKITVHHTAGPAGTDPDVDTIAGWHENNGWGTIGYHYVIRKSGDLFKGRDETELGCHTGGHNTGNIGIHVGGSFSEEEPTQDQINTLTHTIADIAVKYKIPIDRDHIKGHYEWDQPGDIAGCPGTNLGVKLDDIVSKAKDMASGNVPKPTEENKPDTSKVPNKDAATDKPEETKGKGTGVPTPMIDKKAFDTRRKELMQESKMISKNIVSKKDETGSKFIPDEAKKNADEIFLGKGTTTPDLSQKDFPKVEPIESKAKLEDSSPLTNNLVLLVLLKLLELCIELI